MKKKIVKTMLLAGVIGSMTVSGAAGYGVTAVMAEDAKAEEETAETEASEETAAEETAAEVDEADVMDFDLSKWNAEMWEKSSEDERKAAVWVYMVDIMENEGDPEYQPDEAELEDTYEVIKTLFEECKDVMKNTTLQDLVDDAAETQTAVEEGEVTDFDLSKWNAEVWEKAADNDKKVVVWICMLDTMEMLGQADYEPTEEEFEEMYEVVDKIFSDKETAKDLTLQNIVDTGDLAGEMDGEAEADAE